MEKRIKVFASEYLSSLEEDINLFLTCVQGKLHDVKFSHRDLLCGDDIFDSFTAILIYTPEESHEKKHETKESQEGYGRVWYWTAAQW